ncbi:TetR/AcrR family transcriptional regulator [Nocardia asteroides]|uniref:TetR/AcrR family transcriptional regulator n=1 Tax=Nocardia asteroides TaxID=1824 RepID=UPI001E43B261|nr:TetR/AcrR family transcriptional regulator [Nocardia asteroides]UGT55137.1 TetR/AcrR family transcriptional regulator [Nocardia asteroides]
MTSGAQSRTAQAPAELGRRSQRLTPEREAELYSAVVDLLHESGYAALTMDAVATRSRSSKATLYRQWQGKPDLVAAALRHQQSSGAEIDTGSLRDDLYALVARMERDVALVSGLIHAVHFDEELRAALRARLIGPELTGFDTLLRRAADRGEIRPEVAAAEYLPHLLVGALIAPSLLDDEPTDLAYLRRYIDAVVLPALGA